jgi:hypothetical protein
MAITDIRRYVHLAAVDIEAWWPVAELPCW